MLAAPEDPPPALLRTQPLTRPARGAATRVHVGRNELVLERTRGGESLLWSDGREARRFVLGLPSTGALGLELRAPRLPIELVLREALSLAPGGRVRGYVSLPLVPTLVFRDAPTRSRELVQLPPSELQAEWREDRGHCYRWATSWLWRFPYRSGEPRAVLPLWVGNRGTELASPGRLTVDFEDQDLHELRGSLVLPPRRIELDDEAGVSGGGR